MVHNIESLDVGRWVKLLKGKKGLQLTHKGGGMLEHKISYLENNIQDSVSDRSPTSNQRGVIELVWVAAFFIYFYFYF